MSKFYNLNQGNSTFVFLTPKVSKPITPLHSPCGNSEYFVYET